MIARAGQGEQSTRAAWAAWPRVDGTALLALALTLFAWAPLLGPDYFMGAHDAHHSLFFPLQFFRGLQDGHWWPRWGPDFAHGYGYPIFVFYAPLSFYIWASFHATGLFGVVASTKATFVVGFALGAAGCYRLGRALWGRGAGLLAALVYTYLPYHLVNIYVRAALAEFVAMGLLPWVALAFLRLLQRPTWRRSGVAALAYGALLGTHNITALLFSPLLGAMILFALAGRWRGGARWAALRRVALPVAAAIALGIAIGTGVWLPSLAEQRFIRIEQWAMQTYQYEDHFVYPSQLLDARWGFGYSVPGAGDGMPFQLGLAALALAALALAAALSGRARFRPAEAGWLLFFALVVLGLVALMLPIAQPIWAASPLSRLVQFPWRLLSVLALPLALLAGSAARALLPPGDAHSPALLLALLLVLYTSHSFAQPQATPPNPRDETQQTWRDYERKFPDMVAMVAQTAEQPAASSMLAALDAGESAQRFEPLAAGITVTQRADGGSSASAQVVAREPGTVRFLSYWYPGWQATLDGAPLAIRADDGPLGLMLVEVPAGEHTLAFRFGDPPLRRAANFVTLGSVALALALVLWGRPTAAVPRA